MRFSTKLLLGSGVGALLLSGAAANAQDNGEAADVVVVTGSRLLQAEDSVSPIQQFDQEAFQNRTNTSITDFLFEQLPANNAASDLSQQTNNNNKFGGNRNASVNLRGLGSENTLVLINGHRTIEYAAPGRNTGWRGVDINQNIPSIAVDRIEILLDGGSALYGTDAVAGVVNLIPNYGFRGVRFDYRSAHHQRAFTTPQYTFSGLFGGEMGNTSVIFAAEYQTSKAVSGVDLGMVDRNLDPQPGDDEFESRQDSNRFHTYQELSGGAGSGGTQADPYCGDGSDLGLDPLFVGRLDVVPDAMGPMMTTIPGGEVCERFGGFAPNDRQLDQRRFSAFSAFQHEFDFPLTLTGEISVSRDELIDNDRDGRAVSSYNQGAPEDNSLFIPVDNPGVVYANTLEPGSWENAEGYVAGSMSYFEYLGALPSRVTSNLYRGSINATYDISENWEVAAGFTYARNEVLNTSSTSVPSRLQAALAGVGGPACVEGSSPGDANCFYYNPFMSAQLPNAEALGLANDPELLRFLSPEQENRYNADFTDLNIVLTGEIPQLELPGGPVGIAVGFNRRTDELEILRDQLSQDASFAGQTVGATNIFGQTTINSVYGEAVFPIMDTLTLQAAARYEDYAEGFNTLDPKVGLNWQPTDYLTVRGSYGQSFRAPSLIHTQGNSIERRLLFTVDNSSPQAPGVITMRANYAVAQQQVPNPDIQPQESENITAGFDFRPFDAMGQDNMGDLNLSFDFVHIDFENLIDLQSGGDVLAQAECNLGAEAVANDPRGEDNTIIELIPANNPDCFGFQDPFVDGAQNVVTQVFTRAINLASVKVQSLDIGLDWSMDTDIGEFFARPNMTYLLTYDEQQTVDAPVIARAGTADNTDTDYPRWRIVAPVGYEREEHRFTFTTRYISGADPLEGGDDPVDPTLYFDAGYRYDVNENIRFSATVNNLTDKVNDSIFAQSNLPPYRRRFGFQLQFVY